MKVYFVGAGAGDPELLTLKAHRLLTVAHCCIWAGSLVNPQLLDVLPKGCEIYDSAKMNLEEIVEVMQKTIADGKDVIRFHTGEPAIFGAIGEQMDALDKLGIDYEVVPGISSFQAAAAALKVELTCPEISQTVILGRTAGRTPVPDSQSLENLAATRSTLCLFLSVGKMSEVANTLAEYYGEDCPAAVVYRASWPDQQTVEGNLSNIAEKVSEAGFNRTAMIIVGHALARPFAHASLLYDAQFTHGYRQGVKA